MQPAQPPPVAPPAQAAPAAPPAQPAQPAPVTLPAQPQDLLVGLPNQPAVPPTVDDILAARDHIQNVEISIGKVFFFFFWGGGGS
jgi:hypothetical protein